MSNSDATKKSVSNIAELLGRLAGALIGLSAIAYFVGYRIESHYLSEAGASWALGLLSPSELIQEGQGVIVAITIFAVSSVMALMNDETTADRLRRKDLILTAIAVMLIIASVITSKYLGNRSLDYGLALVAGLVWASAAGFTVGELIARLNASNHSWEGYHVNLLFFAYISALATAPYFIGANRAKLDFDPSTTSLPLATVGGTTQEEWRVVRTIGENYLLVALSEDPTRRKFRIEEITSGVVVNSKAIKAK